MPRIKRKLETIEAAKRKSYRNVRNKYVNSAAQRYRQHKGLRSHKGVLKALRHIQWYYSHLRLLLM